MARDDRSSVNPFSGKKHYDTVDDDKFIEQSFKEYYEVINRVQLLDTTSQGQLVSNVAFRLIRAVEDYLSDINRSDYTMDYYEWEFHLVADDTVNAFCMPGGKIVMFSGILGVANTEEKVAFILSHEMAHALLDHSRTRISAQNTQNAITSAAWIGSIAMDLLGFGSVGSLTRAATGAISIGSEFFLMNPWGRDQELEADRLGMMICHWVGYDISNIPDFWRDMSSVNSNEHDFFSTHPADSKRIEAMYNLVDELESDDFSKSHVIGGQSINSHHCPKCKTKVDMKDKFCTNCGYNLKLECPNCGFKIGDGDRFCTNCGYRL